MKDLFDMFELIISLKTQHVLKDQTPCVLIISTVETDISDHHSLSCTMLRSTFCKGPSKFICCRSYNNYNKEQFENVLKQRLVSSSSFE